MEIDKKARLKGNFAITESKRGGEGGEGGEGDKKTPDLSSICTNCTEAS